MCARTLVDTFDSVGPIPNMPLKTVRLAVAPMIALRGRRAATAAPRSERAALSRAAISYGVPSCGDVA